MHESFKYRKVIMLECFTLPNIYRPQRSCGKVIFSQACVKNSVHREGCAWQGGVHGRGCAWWGACMAGGACVARGGGMHGRGACMANGACMVGGVHGGLACVVGQHAWQGGGHVWWGVCMAGKTAIAAGGTHPTGMHSCYILFPDLLSESGVCHHCRDWNTTVNKPTDKATLSHSFCIFTCNIK